MKDNPERTEMEQEMTAPINPFLIAAAAMTLLGTLLVYHSCGLLDLEIFWHYWLLLLC